MNVKKGVYQLVASRNTYDGNHIVHVSDIRSSMYSRTWSRLCSLFQAILILTVFIQGGAIIFLNRAIDKSCMSKHGMRLQRTEPRTLYQHSSYISMNEEEASAAWNAILPGHGVVAIEPEYASAKGLPDTVILPNTGGKLGYVIEAYHGIHCVVNLRQHYLALYRNETWDWSLSHDMHCFDALRQYIMCNIDDTLLHSWGNRDAGHNQEKRCHDWDRLRDWAEARSAEYFDVEPGMGIRHLGNYHEGDGLPIGSLS